MAATFIKKNDGNFYMRLTDNTTQVKFAAVSSSANIYDFIVNGTIVVQKTIIDADTTVYYTTSAVPIPAGGILDNSRFNGAETVIYNFGGSGTRDYILSFTASPYPGTTFYLGGSPLTWGGYAYPGSGYISNPISAGVKINGSWKSAGNIFVKQSGQWKSVSNIWIKENGVWKKAFQDFGNSSWINMLENIDDAIDFGVKVIALN